MAVSNYGLVVDTSNFLPYTFDEIIKPFLLYKKDYEDTENKIELYAEDFGKLELSEDPESPNYSKYASTYNKWKEDFNNAADSFAEGMTLENKNALRKAFKTAKKDITPIREGVAAFNEWAKEVNKLRATNPYMIIEDNYKVDDFVGGKVPKLKALSGEAIEKDATAAIAALANLNPAMPELFGKVTDAFVYIKQGGFSGTDLLAFNMAIQMLKQQRENAGNPLTSKENKELNKFYSTLLGIVDKYDDGSWTGKNKQSIIDYAITGAIKGMPVSQWSMQQGPGYTTPYLSASLNIQREAQKIDLLKANVDLLPYGLQINDNKKLEAIPETIVNTNRETVPNPMFKISQQQRLLKDESKATKLNVGDGSVTILRDVNGQIIGGRKQLADGTTKPISKDEAIAIWKRQLQINKDGGTDNEAVRTAIEDSSVQSAFNKNVYDEWGNHITNTGNTDFYIKDPKTGKFKLKDLKDKNNGFEISKFKRVNKGEIIDGDDKEALEGIRTILRNAGYDAMANASDEDLCNALNSAHIGWYKDSNAFHRDAYRYGIKVDAGL